MKQRAKSLKRLVDYRFLNPAGHFGFIAVTFFVTLPFTQVIVNFLVVDFALAVGLGKGVDAGIGVAVGVGVWEEIGEGVPAEDVGSDVAYLKLVSLNCEARYGVNFS